MRKTLDEQRRQNETSSDVGAKAPKIKRNWHGLSWEEQVTLLGMWRYEAARQLILLVRDIPVLAAFVLLLCTLFRIVGVVLKLIQSQK